MWTFWAAILPIMVSMVETTCPDGFGVGTPGFSEM